MPEPQTPWPHAPPHQLQFAGTFFVTAATVRHEHHFAGSERVGVLHRGLLKLSAEFGWQLEAWAIFSNHYHFVGHSPANADTADNLRLYLGKLHSETARWINRLEGREGRPVWHNYWETRLTFEKSFLARLRYTHENPVKHGLVREATLYPWCSASWFERTARPAFIRTIKSFPIDRLTVRDEHQPSTDW